MIILCGLFLEDRHDRWQALEGLGTVAFRLKRLDRATIYFQKALAALTDSEEEVQSRIVGKLTQVLELKLAMKKKADAQRHDDEKVYHYILKHSSKVDKNNICVLIFNLTYRRMITSIV